MIRSMFMVLVCVEFEFKYDKIVCHPNCASAVSNTFARVASGNREAFLCDLVPAQRRICNSDRSEPFEVKMAFKNYFLFSYRKPS